MANFARIINGVAVDVCAAPHEFFHPDVAVQFEPVPDEVEQHWELVSGSWQAPVQPDPAPAPQDDASS